MARALKRQLGLTAVIALVMGDMLGSGIFFTPGELAAVADRAWQVYFIWALCGGIVLCGALTLGELATLLPRAGSTYHIMNEAFGPFWGFVKAWMEIWVSLPGSVAGIAVVFGEYVVRFSGDAAVGSPRLWGVLAILVFIIVNLLGVRWGGNAQILLTATKILGLLALVAGSLLLAEPAASSTAPGIPTGGGGGGLAGFLRFIGLGVAAVLFTYDGWTDVSHVAGEVSRPRLNLPWGLGLGVAAITGLYLLVNLAFLRVVPLDMMREEPATIATAVAEAAFGDTGGRFVTAFIMVSIFGALGGLVMTGPRLTYAFAVQNREATARAWGKRLLDPLAYVTETSAVPAGGILFGGALAVVALLFFRTFNSLVSFILVPLQLMNILMVAAVYRLRRRVLASEDPYLTPGYPVVPAIFIVVMSLLLVNALFYNPVETLIGLGVTAAGIPFYLLLRR